VAAVVLAGQEERERRHSPDPRNKPAHNRHCRPAELGDDGKHPPSQQTPTQQNQLRNSM